jgi:hypothetical protein
VQPAEVDHLAASEEARRGHPWVERAVGAHARPEAVRPEAADVFLLAVVPAEAASVAVLWLVLAEAAEAAEAVPPKQVAPERAPALGGASPEAVLWPARAPCAPVLAWLQVRAWPVPVPMPEPRPRPVAD